MLLVTLPLALVLGFHCCFAQAAGSQAIITGTQLDVDLHGNIYVLDDTKNVLKLFSKDYTQLADVGGSGWLDTQFDQPAGLWAKNGIDVFVADYGNHRIQRFDRKLAFISSFFTRDRNNVDERFGYPTDVAVSRMGEMYLCDGENARIIKLSGFSRIELAFGGLDAGRGRLRHPTKIEIGPNDNVYVLDGQRILVFDGFGNYLQELAEGVFSGEILLFGDEAGVTVANANILYFFDEQNRLRTTYALESALKGGEQLLRSFAISRGTLYLLTSSGLVTVPDPRQ